MLHLYRFQDLNIVLDEGSGAVHAVSDPVFDILSFYRYAGAAPQSHGNQPPTNPDAGAALQSHSDPPSTIIKSNATRSHPVIATVSEQSERSGKQSIGLNCGEITAQLSRKYTRETIDEAMGEIEELKSDGLLFAPSPPEDEVSPEGRGAVIKAMCLHVAHDCNMRCAYCFADAGGFAGERSLMPLDTGKKAIDFLLEQSGGRRNLEIDFFGGEPLLNFNVVKALVLYGREREKECGKHIRFTLTTNGLMLDDDKTAFINEHMDNVILSIDGRPEVNDRMRKTPGGDGTYALIIDKLKTLVEARKANAEWGDGAGSGDGPGSGDKPDGSGSGDEPIGGDEPTSGGVPGSSLYYVRGTYTAFNKDFAEDVRHLASLGFENISVEPAVTAADEPWALTEADLPELYDEYDRLAELVLESEEAGNPVSFFHFKVDLEQGPCVFKRASGCGAGTAYVAVTPEGDVYPCHQFAGEPSFKLGNVHEPAFENKLAGTFEKAHIFAKEECRNCWAKYYCSGGCHAAALHCEGDILKPHRLSCALEKKRLELAIGLAAKRTLSCEND